MACLATNRASATLSCRDYPHLDYHTFHQMIRPDYSNPFIIPYCSISLVYQSISG
jgi:hypothetical protein